MVVCLIVSVCIPVATYAQPSQWAKRVAGVAPKSVEITDITETDKGLVVRGTATALHDVGDYMRLIDHGKLGTPDLEYVRTADGVSKFELNVARPR